MAIPSTTQIEANAKANRRLWTGVAITAFCLIALPLAMFALWSYRYSKRVAQKLEAIAAKGEPIVADQLNAMYRLTPEEDDVTELWRQSFKVIYESNGQQWSEQLFRQYATRERPTILARLPREGEAWPNFKLAEAYLQEFKQAHDQLHEAAKRGGHARWKIDYNDGNRVLSQVDQAHRCVWVLQLEFYVHAKKGDVAACGKCLKTMLAIRNALTHEPCVWTQVTANRVDQVALEIVAQGLCILPYSQDDLIEIQTSLRARRIMDNFRLGLVSNRAEGNSAMNSYGALGEESPWMPPTSFDLDFYLEAMNEYINALESPAAKVLQKFEAIDARVSARADKSKTQFSLAYSSLFLQPKSPILIIAFSTEAKVQAADAGIAIELYRREQGKFPPSLDALVPKYLPSVPTDPYSGKPMLLKLEEKGFTIYGVGKNKVDDDGSLEWESGDEGLFFPVKSQ